MFFLSLKTKKTDIIKYLILFLYWVHCEFVIRNLNVSEVIAAKDTVNELEALVEDITVELSAENLAHLQLEDTTHLPGTTSDEVVLSVFSMHIFVC